MISIIKNNSVCKMKNNSDYSLYVNDTLQIDFEHYREPEDLAQLLRDAANAIDLSNGIAPTNIVIQTPQKKLSMMDRLSGIHQHLESANQLAEKQEMDH